MFKFRKVATIPADLQDVANAIRTIPVTSDDAERGFSTTNIIATPLRNRLSIPRLSNLLFVNLVGPPLTNFNPMLYVKKWLVNHRTASDNRSKKLAKNGITDYR